MKKSLGIAAGVLGLALANSAAHAVVINGTNVGSLDTFKCAIDSANSGQSTEEGYVQTCVGQAVSLVDNIDTSSYQNDGTNGFIGPIGTSPGFFLLKFGNPGANDMFIFQNLANLNYLAFSLSDLLSNGLTSQHLFSISHYTYGGTTTGDDDDTQVPEPGSLALLGLGLVGLGFTRRKVTGA